jgi:transposase
MKVPLFVRPLSEEERKALRVGCSSRDAFTLRRCQIILASADRERAGQIASRLQCCRQTVRNVIHAFEEKGLKSLMPQSSRPLTVQPLFHEVKKEQLKALLHSNLRSWGKKRSTWTLRLLTEVCFEQGVTQERVSLETCRQALCHSGVSWKRAKNWLSSPDEQYQLKKRQRERFIRLAGANPDWVLGFSDEVWWSRLAQPEMHSWTDNKPLRLLQKSVDKDDPDKKALSSYGLWCPKLKKMLLRFVEERPISEITCEFLQWVCQILENGKTKVLALG